MASTLIIGGGLAGLFLALKLAPSPCTVLSPRPLGEGTSSSWAQGGVAAAIQPGDSVRAHVEDTVRAGAGLVDEVVARGMAMEASARIHDLLAYGVPFDRDLEGQLMTSREAAHSHSRVVRVKGDQAGAKIMEALVAAVRRTPSIRVLEGAEAVDLIVERARIAGVRMVHHGKPMQAFAGHVVLATGGIGHLYSVTTNPREACGQGLGMAALAGASIRDPEFVQFHPTGLAVGRDPTPLLTEALRGEGAILVNGAGERFMLKHHPDAELAPRDIVARGVFEEIKAGRGAFLDTRAAVGAELEAKFPTVFAACVAAGLDPVKDVLPVAPAQHYHMGGVMTDAYGQSSIPGLFAVGEVSSTGVHGANRLASNSLLEAVVFAARTAANLAPLSVQDVVFSADSVAHDASDTDVSAIEPLRPVMQGNVGVLRDAEGMKDAVATIRAMLDRPKTLATRNALVAAEMIAASALMRKESRGGHARTDFPETERRPHHSLWTRDTLRAMTGAPLSS